MALSFAADIRPLFRDEDVECMQGMGIDLADPAWMCVPANAQGVYERIADGSMPPDERGLRIRLRFTSRGWMEVVRLRG